MLEKPCMHRGCPLKTLDKYCEFHVRLHEDERPITSERAKSELTNPLSNTERNLTISVLKTSEIKQV